MKPGFARIVCGREELKKAAHDWRVIYKRPRDGVMAWGASYDDIVAKLDALDLDACSVADLNAAIQVRMGGWGELRCDGCDQTCGAGLEHENILRLGDEPDYDAQWVDLCPDCFGALRGVLEFAAR